MNKWIKLAMIVIGIIILAGGLLIVNSLFGNPVSKMIAKSSAEKYLEKNYHEEDFVIEDVFYNFKDGAYNVNIMSPSSIDSHFSLTIPFNKVVRDSYEDDVLSGWNTYRRIDEEYRKMVEKVLSAEDFPLASDIDFGTIEIFDKNAPDSFDQPDYGVQIDGLELDKIYDVKELAKTTGHIVYYAENADISFTKASDYLMIIKNELDEAGIPFYAIDFVLQNPKEDTGKPYEDEASIHTANFLYSDIYEEDLAKRLEENHDLLMDYYGQEDEKMKNIE